MIDEKKLIEDLLHNDGIEFQMDFKCSTDEETLHSIQQFADKLKEGIVNLINAQPKLESWINPKEQPPNHFESVLIHVPGDHPLPTVHEGYLTPDEIFMSVYGEAYTMDEVPMWKLMPTPPKDGGGA